MAKKPAKKKSDDEDDEAEGEAPAKGGLLANKKKLVIIVAAALVVLLAGGGGAYYFLAAKKPKGEQAQAEEKKVDPNAALAKPVIHEMPDITVDLRTTNDCRIPFIKLKLRIAVATDADVAVLKEIEPFFLDKLKTHLRNQEPADLRGAQGAEKLRFDIVTIINGVTGKPLQLRNVLFKEFILQ